MKQLKKGDFDASDEVLFIENNLKVYLTPSLASQIQIVLDENETTIRNQ